MTGDDSKSADVDKALFTPIALMLKYECLIELVSQLKEEGGGPYYDMKVYWL